MACVSAVAATVVAVDPVGGEKPALEAQIREIETFSAATGRDDDATMALKNKVAMAAAADSAGLLCWSPSGSKCVASSLVLISVVGS